MKISNSWGFDLAVFFSATDLILAKTNVGRIAIKEIATSGWLR